MWNGEEVVETALQSGADFGIKATAGALKVGVEKGVVTVTPKGNPAGTLANIVHVAVEDVKIIGKMATGEYTFKEGLDKLEQTTVATAGGLLAIWKGAAVGANIGAFAGTVGGFIGGTIGYMAGSKVGETVVKVHQKIRDKAVEIAKEVGSLVREIGRIVGEGVRNFASSIGRGFATFFGF